MTPSSVKVIIALIGLAGGLAGCSRSVVAPEPLPLAEIPTAMQTAFARSETSTREAVSNMVVSLQSREHVKALWLTESLLQRPNLKPPQRLLLNRCQLTLVAEAQAAATRGDQNTAAVLEQRRAVK